jgi:Arm DNA-binding domain
VKSIRLDAKTVPTLTSLADDRIETILWDEQLPRFGLRLRRSGGRVVRTYIAQYRRAGASLRCTIGSADVLTPDQARATARKLLAKVELGEDPQGDRNARRAKDAITFRSVVAEYLEAKRDELRPTTLRANKAYLTGPYFKTLHGMPVDRRRRAACGYHSRKRKADSRAGAQQAQRFFHMGDAAGAVRSQLRDRHRAAQGQPAARPHPVGFRDRFRLERG